MQRDSALDADIQQTEKHEPHKEAEIGALSSDRTEEVDVDAGDRSHFFSVANALLWAIHPNSPELVVPETLTRRESNAIKLIYEAKIAKQSEQGAGHMSGAERMRQLELGLAVLQRVLAMARHPDFVQARAHIEEIRKRLFRLKEEIKQQILEEDRKKMAKKKKPDEKKAEDEAAAKKKAEIESAGRK
ncbi:MAG TPA: hypothetical protein VKZ63_19135 [Kofleriaceae bacterium]|nr:hypothetical protein [Kofleriaceae bacterium]